jgi:hypothetical protein
MTVQGGTTTPYEGVAQDGVSAVETNRFPVPPTSWGFLTIVDFGLMLDGLSGGALVGALVPEGSFLEPTTGQIWPR